MGEAAGKSGDDRRVLRLAMLAVSAGVGIWAALGAVSALLGEPKIWGLLGFEVVTVIAAVLGVLAGRGWPREAPALSAACVAATIFAAATLGRFSAIVTRAEGALSGGQAVGRLVRDPVFDGRVLAAVALGAIALALALDRDRAACRRLIVGVGLGVPVVGAAAWLLVGSGLEWVLAPAESFLGIVRIVGTLIGGIALAILASISVDKILGAFEIRLPALPGATRPGKAKAAGKSA